MSGYQSSREKVEKNVPAELRARRQWVGYVFVQDPPKSPDEEPPKPRKVPLDPKPTPRFDGRVASSSDPSTWGTFDQACEGVEKYRFVGVGYVFAADDPYCGFDFDDVREPRTFTDIEGRISVEGYFVKGVAQQALDKIAPYGYAEISPSGTGIHVILKGTLPRKQAKRTMPDGWSVEAYSAERYFTITGDEWGAS
nr:hypothetical protein [Chloroflexota bacterium]